MILTLGLSCSNQKSTLKNYKYSYEEKLEIIAFCNQGFFIKYLKLKPCEKISYLKENKTWAKQTIAHNTVAVNEKSHFGGKFKVGNEHHSDKYFFDAENENFQIASAKETNAYPGTEMHRTMALLKDDEFQNPLVIDVFRVKSDKKNQYDLPVWFRGHILETNFEYNSNTVGLTTLGKSHGYQHVWKEAFGIPNEDNAQLSWFRNGDFYTLTAVTGNNQELIFGRLGANDPKFNLRPDQCFIIRQKDSEEAIFVSVIEAHGTYSPVNEVPLHPYGNIKSVELLHNDANYTAVKWTTNSDKSWILFISNNDNSKTAKHTLKVNDQTYSWTGTYLLK